MELGDPPKLHGHDTVQLQLSATVAVMCQDGVCAAAGCWGVPATTATPVETNAMRAAASAVGSGRTKTSC